MCLNLKVCQYYFNIKIYFTCFKSCSYSELAFISGWLGLSRSEQVFFQLIPDALTSLTVLFQQFNVIIEGVLWGVEIAGWTMDRKTRVRFPAYPYRVWAFWLQGGESRLPTSWCPCRGRLGTLKTPSCPWRWVPGSRSKFENWTTVQSLYSWYNAECGVKPQPTNSSFGNWRKMGVSFIRFVLHRWRGLTITHVLGTLKECCTFCCVGVGSNVGLRDIARFWLCCHLDHSCFINTRCPEISFSDIEQVLSDQTMI